MLKYTFISRKNPVTKEFAYHATLLPVTPISMDELATEVSNSCTVTVHDIKAVVSALEERIYKALRNGQSVRLGDLGSFHPRLSSSGTATEDEFTMENVRGVRVRFSPSSKMRHELRLNNPNVVLERHSNV